MRDDNKTRITKCDANDQNASERTVSVSIFIYFG